MNGAVRESGGVGDVSLSPCRGQFQLDNSTTCIDVIHNGKCFGKFIKNMYGFS